MKLSSVAAALLLASTAATSAIAGPDFTRVVAFGDSYADSGNVKALLTDDGLGAFFDSTTYPTGRFSGGTNFVDTIATLYGVPQANFAIGGAEAGSGNVALNGFLPGFQQQWQAFTNGGTAYVSSVKTVIPAGGEEFSPTDLAVFSVGGNDARGYRVSGGTLAGAPAAAETAATEATTGLDALLARGLKHLVWTAGDVGQLPEAIGLPSAATGTAFSVTYNTQMQSVLSGVARSGVQVAYVDITTIGNTIRANPGLFGITNSTQACPETCVGNPAMQATYLFYVDGVHLTSAGFAAVGAYAVNQIDAPYSFAANGDVVRLSAQQFGQAIDNRLDLSRGAHAHGLSVFGQFTAAHQDFHADATENGYDFNSRGGVGGLEYGVGPATLGGIFSYTNNRADGGGDDRAHDRSYQVGGYASVDLGGFFAQGYGGYGWHDLSLRRTGVAAPLTASPHAHSISAGARIGYLVPLGVVQIGPTVGIDYAFARVAGYTEAGDPAASLTVERQSSEALTGSAGIEARASLLGRVTPWLRASAEKDLVGDGRTIFYAPTVAPTIVNAFDLSGRPRRAYGAVEGGLSAALVHNISLDFTGRATFRRADGNDAGGLVGVKFGF